MKTRILKYFSPRLLSMNTAYASPAMVEMVGTISTQTTVLSTMRTFSGWVKIQAKLSRPTNRSPRALMKACTVV